MLTNKPLVSVIIPCFNCEQWILKCINSILSQDYPGFIEIICIDDYSTDSTVQKISKIECTNNRSIKIFENPRNMGPAFSRNRAIKEAKGEWIAFCDADDWFDLDFISLMLGTGLSENSDLVMCNYKKILESNNEVIVVDYLHSLSQPISKEKAIIYSKASLCLIFLRRTILQHIEIPDLRNGEDMAIVPVIESLCKKISIVKKPLYNYFIRSNSSSNSVNKNIYKSLCNAYYFIDSNLSNNYSIASEFLGVRTVLYGATINAFKANVPLPQIKFVIETFTSKYPKWFRNEYISTFSKAKKLYLVMLKFKCYFICKQLAILHQKMSL